MATMFGDDGEQGSDVWRPRSKAGAAGSLPATKSTETEPVIISKQQLGHTNQDKYWDFAAAAQNQAEQGPFRQNQINFMNQLQQRAAGQGPSVGAEAMRQGAEQAQKAAMAQAASARGGMNPALAQRNAMMAGNEAQMGAASQGAMLRAQEAQGALGQYGTQVTAGREMEAKQQAAKNALAQQYMQMGMTSDMAQLQADMDHQKNSVALETGQAAANTQLAGAAIGAGGAALAGIFSDEKLKKDVQSDGKEMYGFLDALKAHKYEYKGKDMDPGIQHSVMAQELEKSPVGKSFVMETPRGKMVDYGKGFGAILAAQAALHERMKSLEKGKA